MEKNCANESSTDNGILCGYRDILDNLKFWGSCLISI